MKAIRQPGLTERHTGSQTVRRTEDLQALISCGLRIRHAALIASLTDCHEWASCLDFLKHCNITLASWCIKLVCAFALRRLPPGVLYPWLCCGSQLVRFLFSGEPDCTILDRSLPSFITTYAAKEETNTQHLNLITRSQLPLLTLLLK